MKTAKLRVVFSWILLLCFAAGQYMVYAHQHRTHSYRLTIVKKPSSKTVTERCDLCDAMHHTVMLPGTQQQMPVIYSKGYFHFVAGEQHFVRIGLILASGRAPPLV